MQQKSVLHSISHASDGLVHCLRTQQHMRLHFVLAFLVMITAALLHVTDSQLLALLFSVTLVIVAEMFNTGIEVIVDVIKPNYDPNAKIIKDVAAGAVLLSSLSSVVIGALVFIHSPVILSLRQHGKRVEFPSSWPELCVEGLLILFILTMAWKMKGYQGSVLRGGPISGRAAFTFFALVLIIMNPAEDVRLLGVAILAIVFLQGTVVTRRYSLRQVVTGALLGITVPGLVFAAHYAFARAGGESAAADSVQRRPAGELSAPRARGEIHTGHTGSGQRNASRPGRA
ncbi:MAG TPA: diacylglycerol kinase [Armatimonadota bacterium]|nr:diacylglycerol kinase [Armatimonadota bacterium]